MGISGSSTAIAEVKNVAAYVGIDARLPGHIVHHDGVGAFGKQLGAAIFHAVLSLGGKAHDELAWPAAAHHLGQNVFRWRRVQASSDRCALELLRGDGDGPVIGDRRSLDHKSGFVHAIEHGVAHLVGGDDLHQFAMRRRVQRRGVAWCGFALAPRLRAASASA